MPPEQLLMRWINYHLERAGHQDRVTNLTTDLAVCSCAVCRPYT